VPYGPLVVLLARPEQGLPWQEMPWAAIEGHSDNAPPVPWDLSPTSTVMMTLQLVDYRTKRVLAQGTRSPEPHLARAIWNECGLRLAGDPLTPHKFAAAVGAYQRAFPTCADALPHAVARGWSGARGIAESAWRA